MPQIFNIFSRSHPTQVTDGLGFTSTFHREATTPGRQFQFPSCDVHSGSLPKGNTHSKRHMGSADGVFPFSLIAYKKKGKREAQVQLQLTDLVNKMIFTVY